MLVPRHAQTLAQHCHTVINCAICEERIERDQSITDNVVYENDGTVDFIEIMHVSCADVKLASGTVFNYAVNEDGDNCVDCGEPTKDPDDARCYGCAIQE